MPVYDKYASRKKFQSLKLADNNYFFKNNYSFLEKIKTVQKQMVKVRPSLFWFIYKYSCKQH